MTLHGFSCGRSLLRLPLAALALAFLATPGPAGEQLENSLGMKFVAVHAGEFTMGSPDGAGEDDERPARRVRISRAFWLGVYEVAQAEYERVTSENPSWFRPHGPGAAHVRGVDAGRLPVEMLSWRDATEFCRRLGELPAEKRAGRRYRLPTEAEWEYACRACSTGVFSGADVLEAKDANCKFDDRAVAVTRPVGSYTANAFGLHDMHGNVWEWCQDPYDQNYYASGPAADPPGPATGSARVVRGGDYRFGPEFARCANRDRTRASRRDQGNGMRVVVELGDKK